MSDYENILIERRGRVGIITLNRPKARNALNEALMLEVVDAATTFDRDAGIGAIVVTGSVRAFAAGADIKEMASKSYQEVSMGGLFAAWDDSQIAANRVAGRRSGASRSQPPRLRP